MYILDSEWLAETLKNATTQTIAQTMFCTHGGRICHKRSWVRRMCLMQLHETTFQLPAIRTTKQDIPVLHTTERHIMAKHIIMNQG